MGRCVRSIQRILKPLITQATYTSAGPLGEHQGIIKKMKLHFKIQDSFTVYKNGGRSRSQRGPGWELIKKKKA